MPNYFKKFLSFFLLIFFFFITSQNTLAITIEDCEKRVGKGELNTQELEECEKIFTDFISQASQQKQSLKNEIDKFNAAISLTTTRIYTTSKQIEALEKEIADLGQKINRLDISLDQISQVLLRRIAETYKKGKIEPLTLLFSSADFSNFVSRWKYLRVMQIHDKKLMIQLENVRTNYEDQKSLKEEKQAELEAAKKKLESQKAILAQQKADKESLLKITQSNEAKYQQLLTQAKAQLAAFRRFTTSQGGATILYNQTKCDNWGCYYNQRDSQWGNMSLGRTEYLMKDSGCFVTSVAMLATHYGKSIKPSDIAPLPEIFTNQGELKWQPFNVGGVNISITSDSKNNLDHYLLAGNSVIVKLSFSYGDHFIVILQKEGDRYIMHDPFFENGSNLSFSDKYSFSDINSLRLVRFD